MTQGFVLRRVTFVLILVATQSNARIDLDSILAFLCVAFLHLVMKKIAKIRIFSRIASSTQRNARALRHIVNQALLISSTAGIVVTD